jgi:hypothetical protein
LSQLARVPDVIAGLDPAIHPLREIPFEMDARVKPGHDEK